ncbi:MAG TPA: hypothetical protein VEJ47_01800 [Candidatus Eremiobacteraceae bacterium]|nr:hypothetical protein [Candidatus Eremiobacteraceae bacterium]
MRPFLEIALCASIICVPFLYAESSMSSADSGSLPWIKAASEKTQKELISKYGEGQRARAERGLGQVAEFWRSEDGDAAAFEEFALNNFAGDQATLNTVFERYERLLEQLNGHMHEINREFRQQSDLDKGTVLPLDDLFAGYDPAAHVVDDFFNNKLAFIVLLNFPLTTLQERLAEGPGWTRKEWAEVRLAQTFSKRIPAAVNLQVASAGAEADAYISQYNIWMFHVVDDKGKRLFPANLRLLSHWNLRDEIKADYTDAQQGLAKQRAIQQVMERIITQTIPQAVINNPAADWNPWSNEVKPATEKDNESMPSTEQKVTNAPEPCTRYAMLLKTFQAARGVDPYSPTAPTLIARRFDEDREIPEKRVRQMLEQVVSSPLAPRVAQLIQTRLGRPLEPFDIWYDGFRARGKYTEAQLDAIVSKRYPTAEAYRKDIPNILLKLGFTPEKAQYLANNIAVEPARGSGHAMRAAMRSEKAHLRTRVESNGMNYKGFNIAVHEMGHNIEQTFSLNEVDYTLLEGVPNTAFTEALAMVVQGHDLEILGLSTPDAETERLRTLNDFWATYEISGVALVDMEVWHWMYDHADATPQQLRDATIQIAKNIWNKYYAPVLGKQDVMLLAIYSHMIDSFMYLPDYPIGHLIGFQVEEQMKKAGAIGPEFERMATFGHVTPDMWMIHATDKPVGAEALLSATEQALTQVSAK